MASTASASPACSTRSRAASSAVNTEEQAIEEYEEALLEYEVERENRVYLIDLISHYLNYDRAQQLPPLPPDLSFEAASGEDVLARLGEMGLHEKTKELKDGAQALVDLDQEIWQEINELKAAAERAEDYDSEEEKTVVGRRRR
uniref:Uncharacterized protein n=1 Tax=Mycena chlorophos TaxID=658473 RepID=A0ABQ0L9U0_MYCCL|nr:predicted protein [Mycena chlorophos]